MRPVPMMAMVLPVTSSPRNGRNGCHDQVLARIHFARQHAQHKKSELGRRFGEHVGGVREWDFVFVGVGTVDVVEADRDLCHDLERVFACFKNLGVDGIAERCDQPVDAALHFVDDQLLRRRFGTLENLQLVAALAQAVLGGIADAGGGKDSFLGDHGGKIVISYPLLIRRSAIRIPKLLTGSSSPRRRRDRVLSRCSRLSWLR